MAYHGRALFKKERLVQKKYLCGFTGAVIMAAVLFYPVSSAVAGWLKKEESRLETAQIHHGGILRSFHYYVPARTGAVKKKRPLLIALHGGGKDQGAEYGSRVNYHEMAEKYGFIVVYPDGINGKWNDGRNAIPAEDGGTEADDVGFLSAVIDVFSERYDIDPHRVFMEGTSNGGMMTYRFMCERSDKIKAAAAVIANMPQNIVAGCRPQNPVSLLIINATEDTFVPYEGGTVAVPALRPGSKPKNHGDVISTDETVNFWVQHNACRYGPHSLQLPDINKRDQSSVARHAYQGCRDGSVVMLYRVEGGGHSRPGSSYFVPKKFFGLVNKDFDAGRTIWGFFSRRF